MEAILIPHFESTKYIGRKRGTTLIELLTAMAVFLLMISTIMAFYSQGARVTRHQDQKTETLRRSFRLLDRFETMLAYSRVIWVGYPSPDDAKKDELSILFTPISSEFALDKNGINWSKRVAKISFGGDISQERPIIYHDISGSDSQIFTLLPSEELSISYMKDYIEITLKLLNDPNSPKISDQRSTEKEEKKDNKEIFYIQTRSIPIYNGYQAY